MVKLIVLLYFLTVGDMNAYIYVLEHFKLLWKASVYHKKNKMETEMCTVFSNLHRNFIKLMKNIQYLMWSTKWAVSFFPFLSFPAAAAWSSSSGWWCDGAGCGLTRTETCGRPWSLWASRPQSDFGLALPRLSAPVKQCLVDSCPAPGTWCFQPARTHTQTNTHLIYT